MFKRTISFILSLSLLACLTSQIYAIDHVAIPQNIHLPTPPLTIQTPSTEFSFKSIESQLTNVFKPNDKVNRKLLASDDSGSCGNSVTYTFTASTGKLTISGTGTMTDYQLNPSYTPWDSYRSSINTVTIDNGVTSIGGAAFYNCKNLKSVTIPSSVTSIRTSAFMNCSNLKSVTIPNGVNEIISNTFDGCRGLTSVTIPSSVTSIGQYAFRICENLKSVTIPSSVTSIGNYAFYYCSELTSVTYKGTSDPGASSSDVFYKCNKIYCLLVPSAYNSNSFCGHSVVKGSCPAPTPTRSRSPLPTRSRSPLPTRSRSPSPSPSRSPAPSPSKSPSPTPSPPYGIKNWFIDNVAWMAPTFSIAVSAIGLLLKYNDVKNFCLSHCPCCHKKCETSEQQQLDTNLL